jgi:hypothetical protein
MLRFFLARVFSEKPPGSQLNQHPEALTACLPDFPILERFLLLLPRTAERCRERDGESLVKFRRTEHAGRK